MPETDTTAPRAASNWVVPLLIIAFCAVAYYLTTTFDRVPPILKRGMQPADFPQLVIGLIALLALWLAVTERVPAPPKLPRMVYLSMLLLVVFPLGVFFLFDSVFEIRFPRGILTNIWYG